MKIVKEISVNASVIILTRSKDIDRVLEVGDNSDHAQSLFSAFNKNQEHRLFFFRRPVRIYSIMRFRFCQG